MKRVVVFVLCFGLRASQVLDFDNDIAQLYVLGKKFEHEDEARRNRESLEGEAGVFKLPVNYSAKSSLEEQKEDYDKKK